MCKSTTAVYLYFNQFGPIDTFKRLQSRLSPHVSASTFIGDSIQQLLDDKGEQLLLLPTVVFELGEFIGEELETIIEVLHKLGTGVLDGFYMDFAMVVQGVDGADLFVYHADDYVELHLDTDLRPVVGVERLKDIQGLPVFVIDRVEADHLKDVDAILLEVAGCNLEQLNNDSEPYANETLERESDGIIPKEPK